MTSLALPRLAATTLFALATAGMALAQESAAPESEAPAAEAAEAAPEAPAAVDYDATTVLATVDGTEITLGHVAQMLTRLPQQYQQLPDEVLYNGILEQLIDQQLMATAQSPDGSLPPAARAAVENEARGQLASRHLNALTAEPIPDDEIEAAYQKEFVDAEPVPQWSASHILVGSEDEAKTIAQEIADGADFAEVAKEKSLDTGSGQRGGSLGWFGQGDMVPEFEAGVAALAPGAISEPIQSQFGWHVIRLDETRDKPVPPLDEVRDGLVNEIRQARVQAELESLREAATIDIPDTGLAPGAMRDQMLLTE